MNGPQLTLEGVDHFCILKVHITMISLLRLRGKGCISQYFYSNINLNFTPERHLASLTLANQKKRNPLSLQTIREINTALTDIQAKIQTENIKVTASLTIDPRPQGIGTSLFRRTRSQVAEDLRKAPGYLRGMHQNPPSPEEIAYHYLMRHRWSGCRCWIPDGTYLRHHRCN